MSERCWTLDPSDIAFLWEDCARCFYLAVGRGFPRPQPPRPAAVARIEDVLKAGCEGRRTETIASELPAGVLEPGEQAVQSAPLDVHLPDTVLRCAIRGALEIVVRLDDGGYAVVDLVVGARPAESLSRHGRRLNACAYALEHPAPGALALGPVTRLGLLVFEPEKFARDVGGAGALTGGVSWVEIPRDDGRLFGFLAEVLAVLERPAPPGGAPLCLWCVYRDASRRTSL